VNTPCKYEQVDITLVGGGLLEAASAPLFRPFVTAAGPDPVIACVILDEGNGDRAPWWSPAGLRQTVAASPFERWTRVLTAAAPCRTRHIPVKLGGRLDVAALSGANALVVAGGLTPGYAAALAPVQDELRGWLADTGAPYAGFSAGSACAAERALVGGWTLGGVPICPADSAEDLEEVTVVAGLGLVPALVDVHCAPWGTLPRLITAVRAEAAAGHPTEGWGIDENTALHLTPDGATVLGSGHLYRVTPAGADVTVQVLAPGTHPDLRTAPTAATTPSAA
jgi:cyanophycinase